MLLVKDIFGGKPGGNCSPDFDLEHDRIGIFLRSVWIKGK